MKKRIVLMLLFGALMMVGSILPVTGYDGSPPMSNVFSVSYNDVVFQSIPAVISDQTSILVAYVYLNRIPESNVNIVATKFCIPEFLRQGDKQSWQIIMTNIVTTNSTAIGKLIIHDKIRHQMSFYSHDFQGRSTWYPNIGYTLCG